MKRLALTLVICLGCMSILGAQNVWKPITCDTPLLGAASNGDLFAMAGYSGLLRSQNEGETWEQVNGNYMHQCIAFSPQGRIFVSPASYTYLLYSDDGGDTWQQTTIMSSCAMNDIGGIYAVSNDIVVVWSLNGEMYYTLDGGMTWGFGGIEIDEYHQVGDLIVNEAGDVYASKWYYSGEDSGIFHSSLSDMQNWELVAFDGAAIHQMEFDPDGNIVAGALWGSLGGFQHEPGFYLIDGQTIAVSDNGIVYHLRYNYSDYTAVLNYSTDHGEHFFDIGEALPTDNPAPGGGSGASIFKGHDNHLYFHGNGQYYKSVRDADHIDNYHPVVEDGKQWNVLFSYPWTPPEPQHKYTDIYKIEGDTLLDGVPYKMMYATRNENLTGWNLWGFIRETEDGQVFSRRPSTSDEQLLYDFSMEVGDTICMCDYGYDECCMVVIEKGEIIVNGEPRQQIVLEYPFGNGVEEVWIEGIGSLFGIVDSGSLFLTGGSTNLLCYYEDGDLIWQNTTPGYDECYMVYPTPPTPPEPHSFAPQGAEWYFHVWSQGPITEPPFYYIRKSVTGIEEVQGHTCSVIDLYDYVYEEDDVVYWYNQTNDEFTVLYDFNAEAGESWICDIEECSFLVTVQSVDNVTWNNQTYRTQYVAGYYADNLDNVVFQGRIIDGIGYEKGLFPNWGSCGIICGADYEYMRCYLEDGELLYHEGDYDCDYVPGTGSSGPEWYYEIQNDNGSVTYQYLYQAGDTIVQDEPTHILVKINTLYDKGLRDEVTHEYVYERDGKLYWWNKTLEEFTVLYDYEAEVGDSWEIKVGTRALDMHVDAVEEIEYEGRVWRMLRVSDPEDLFSGNIVCGIGHLTSFFPERLMDKGDGVRVEGLRCYWVEDELVFKYGDEDCDAVISELHGVEEDGPSTGSETFAVYPNPTNGVLFVETVCTPSLPVETYRIANLMGQTVLTGQITAETQQINVSSLPQGMYFITFAGETQKFVVR